MIIEWFYESLFPLIVKTKAFFPMESLLFMKSSFFFDLECFSRQHTLGT